MWFYLIIKQHFLIVSNVEKIQKVKTQKLQTGEWHFPSKLAVCGSKKSKFMKEQVAGALLSNLGIKTPVSKFLQYVLFSIECIKLTK